MSGGGGVRQRERDRERVKERERARKTMSPVASQPGERRAPRSLTMTANVLRQGMGAGGTEGKAVG